ncbi:MAG: PKD domain-containing protein [Schleiferiaceae bacterium]|nr:PKD domain-containing protein [Schleiferiaceae bacterium]
MKIRYSILFIAFILASGLYAQHFVENQGQWKEDFSYKWTGPQGAFFFEDEGLTIHLVDYSPLEYFHDHRAKDETFDASRIKHHAVRMNFVQGNSNNWKPLAKRKTYHNYILRKDSKRWKNKVPIYNALMQEEIFQGVDIKYYTDGNTIKYDLYLEPRIDPAIVKMEYTGLDSIYLEEGFLIMRTSLGEIIEQKPIAWQIKEGKNIAVKCDFTLEGNTVSFKVEKRNKKLPLVIDPQYIFSTYTGSLADNFGYTASFDSLGNMYGGGIAFATGYPVTVGAFQDTFAGGLVDIAISKFNVDGTQLLYSTYIGGSGPEQPNSMVASNDGGLVIMGVTGSNDYPVTLNALDTSFNGGPTTDVGFMQFQDGVDIIVTHLDSTGGVLVGSTFVGGTGTDGTNKNLTHNYGDNSRGEVIYDSTCIHVASSTFSNDFMGTNWGTFTKQNAVLFSLNNDCSQAKASRVLLGSDDDAAYSLRVMRENGNYFIIAAGGTKSPDLPTSANAYQKLYGGGLSDGFIMKYDWYQDTIVELTYNGSGNYDQNFFVELDRDNSVYVYGQTLGAYPISPATWAIANSAQFLHKLSSDLSVSHRSTVFGNGMRQTVNISPTAFMVDDCKNIYLSGWGGQVSFQQGSTIGLPTTPDARDSTTDGNDFYFMVLDGSWQMLEYASFFGEQSREHVDGGTSRFNNDGTMYQAICAGCSQQSFPTFPANVYSHVNGSANCNLGSTKIEFTFTDPIVDVSVPQDTNCVPYTLQYVNNSKNVDVLIWNFGDGDIDTGFAPTKVYNDTGDFMITIIGIDTLCQTWDTTRIPLRLESNFVLPGFDIAPYDTCSPPFTISITNNTIGATGYTWLFGDGNTSTQKNPTHTYSFEGEFTVTMIAFDDVCQSADTVTQTVVFKNPATDTDFILEHDHCSDPFNVSLLQLGSGFQTHIWDMGDGNIITGGNTSYTYSEPGTYTIKLTSFDSICKVSAGSSQIVNIIEPFDESRLMPNVFTPNGDGTNDYLKLIDPTMLGGYDSFYLKIYNRWGGEVYETYDPLFQWDGRFENKPLGEGVYFWLVNTFDDCNEQQEYNGVVHIIY